MDESSVKLMEAIFGMSDHKTELADGISDALRQAISSLRHSAYNFMNSLQLKNSLELNERLHKIILWRYGFESPSVGFKPTYENIGELLGITRERVRQIEGKSLRMLRHPSRSRLLREYILN